MDLNKEILIKLLEKETLNIKFENFTHNPTEIVELKCYDALKKIKAILENDSFNDIECFNKIEEIICVFEDLGSGCGTRHDFG